MAGNGVERTGIERDEDAFGGLVGEVKTGIDGRPIMELANGSYALRIEKRVAIVTREIAVLMGRVEPRVWSHYSPGGHVFDVGSIAKPSSPNEGRA